MEVLQSATPDGHRDPEFDGEVFRPGVRVYDVCECQRCALVRQVRRDEALNLRDCCAFVAIVGPLPEMHGGYEKRPVSILEPDFNADYVGVQVG